MGFYELGNGCDSCESVQMLPQNVNMDSGMGSYGLGSNPMKQFNSAVSSGYVPNGTNLGAMGTGSTGMSMGGQPAAVKQVTTTVTTTNVPTAAATVTPGTPTNKVEGFTNNNSTTQQMLNKTGKQWILLGLVVFCSLAANECCKYFLNKSIQLDGSPMYYVGYVAITVLLAYAAYTYLTTTNANGSSTGATSM
uniref:Uncharacterized protein n=1 Tax=viral metagenome TaxID=1070528 RepID=A0A6C0HL40_9ZZZZ